MLAGPRGRRLLWELLGRAIAFAEPWRGWHDDGPIPSSAEAQAQAVTSLREAATAAEREGLTGKDLLRALSATVDEARYWQPPAALEAVLALGAMREVLEPFAALVATAVPAWWDAPCDRASQHRVRWVDERIAGDLPDPAVALARWRARTVAEQSWAAARHAVDDSPWSGTWWSTPGRELATTTRSAGGLPTVHLALVEDELGWTAADVEPVAVASGARVLEIARAGDWADLVARYPLEVTHGRRFDWWQATGRAGRWFLPDFAAVAADVDAVHVSVAGWLNTAGWAVPVPGQDGATVLAGWSPDQTWWLTDRFSAAGPARRWERAPDQDTPWDWRPAG